MGTTTLVDGSTGWILGWTLVNSLWQGALVAAGLALVFRYVPGSMARLRALAAWGGLALVIGLAAVTLVLVDTEWRGHAACWDSESYARQHPALCASHAVPIARELHDKDEGERAAMPLAWVRRMALPVPGSVRSVSLAATGAVALLALVSGALALAAFFRLAIGLGLLRGLLRRARPLRHRDLEGLLRRLAGEMGVNGRVELRESDEISTPAVAGWRRPIVLVPRRMADVLAPERLADVLAHELAHVRGRHFVVNLLQRALDCLCVFNPFALWISGRIREEREVRCDRIAAGPPAPDRRHYIETLVQLEHLRGPVSPALIGLLGEGRLLRRIRRIVEAPSGRGPGRARATLVAVGAAVVTVVVVVQISLSTVALTSWSVMSHDIALREAAEGAAPAAAPPGSSSAAGETAGR